MEARALEGNAYLSPDFVLPVARHLEPSAELRVIEVRSADPRAPRLAGVGLFRDVRGHRRFPLAHLEAFSSRHSYLTGLLVDAECAGPVLDALFGYLTDPGAPWHGVAFTDWRTDGALGQAMLESARRAGATWQRWESFQRAALVPGRLGEETLETALERWPGSTWRKKVKRLLERGELQWRFLDGARCDSAALDRFLSLEDRDWAREAGSSLRASGHDRMFREIYDGFARDGRLFMSELALEGEVIASTSNFISGPSGFAFKLGWDDAHARLRPGILNELLLRRVAGKVCADHAFIDSGTQPGSFLESIWEDRISLESGVFATSRLGHAAAATWGALRGVKRAVQGALGTSG